MNSASTDGRIQVGSTFLIPSGSEGNHLFVVVLSGRLINGKEHLLLACLCTIKGLPYDGTCVVKQGEHAFAVSDSYIAYRHSRSEPVDHVIARLDEGVFKAKADSVSSELLTRIKSGLRKKTMPRHIKDDWDLIEE